jgi:hypothetical protein
VKRLLFLALFAAAFTSVTVSQAFTDSNLPIVIINTDNGVPIIDDPRVMASMKIIFRGEGERNYVTDQNNPLFLNYDGRIDIELRGSSSQDRAKRQYGFTTLMADGLTNNNVELLGLPEENDWILNGMVFDPALLRDYLCYNLSRAIGEYASRTVYCELIVNGDYRGLYLLQEKIKADDNRVDVTKIEKGDNSLPKVTGGYITKADKTTGGDPVAWTMKSWSGATVDFIHELPKPENVTLNQNDYIHNRFTDLEIAAVTGDASFSGGWPSIIDITSFINYMIIAELSSNADSYQYSTFFHQDRNGRLRAGPVWDNDLTFGNDLFFWGYDRSKTNVWQFANGDNEGPSFWRNLFFDDRFRCQLSKRWNELIQPGQPLNPSVLDSFINQTVANISEAVARNDAKWGNTGSFSQRIFELKNFLTDRIPWISGNLGSYGECTGTYIPSLVISAINYHPADSPLYPDNDDMEFIGITNTGNEDVAADGLYFAGTGFVFQFPAGSVIGAGESVFLAGDFAVFRTLNGFMPFGRFSRSLSNKSEDLVLCDAFGNIVDRVQYSDSAPWPDADGNGYYLKLVSEELDNNDPANWIASDAIVTSAAFPESLPDVRFYPNPVRDNLTIENGFAVDRVSVYDIYGRQLTTVYPEDTICLIDMSDLPAGIYLLIIEAGTSVTTGKIIKY